MPRERRPLAVFIRIGIVLAPILAGCFAWMIFRPEPPSTTRPKSVASATTRLQSKSTPEARVDTPAGLSTNASPSGSPHAAVLSKLPLSSVPAISAPVDLDPASFRELMTPPPGPPRATAQIDPRQIRSLVDRGVVAYSSATTDAARAQGARLIQIAALVGYPPARELLARNYPQSAAIRSVVSANDAIRYAVGFLMDPTTAADEAKPLFFALARHFALEGELDVLATHLLDSLRGDTRPQLSHRIDVLLELLARVRGSCAALARLLATSPEPSDQDCSLSFRDRLQQHIETIASVGREEDSRRRGLLLLNQADVR